ncbi:Planctomycete cytochrome C [Maioricimonas rarisocia]|uniref:Planctomycete cytochrome C n=1 Tax=Maioricimonas rarisocia TaxID=2528026 RepID=A0A517Z928_9PLAN|nr:DUF1553 domain-containing protein [Maioricimonas rarisocia]QDU38987.1 Planctomycete cytochrome C [Maioricimonas rarisocia]
MATHRTGTTASEFIIIACLLLISSGAVPAFGEVRFNRDVRPILSENCWRCHGFDAKQRQAGLRLDVREDALRPADSGLLPIVPGKPDQSELIARIAAQDESLRMPPPDAHQQLSPAQVETLSTWIAEGAVYERHWAFEPIRKPPVPDVDGALNPIDAFVAARLEREGLDFADEATPETLLRRICFDLTGLPPTLDDIERFEKDGYEQTVDRLLASPHFGERMAADWLDAARYADTNGYFGDRPREIWLWRNWVIDAFNANMPYDQFTIEQLAGDLLPNASVSQRIATGFNRNHMANNETGIIDEEYRVEYVVDRIDTTMTTWLGLTVGCAQCHDHKYDPITQREFYSLFAFFNTVPERGLLVGNNPPPLMSVPTPEQEENLTRASAARGEAEERFAPLRAEANRRMSEWEMHASDELEPPPADNILQYEAFEDAATDGVERFGTPPQSESGVVGQAGDFDATRHLEAELPEFSADEAWTIGLWIKPDGPLSCVLSKIEPDSDRRGLELLWMKGRLMTNLVGRWKVSAIEVATINNIAAGRWHHVVLSYDGSKTAAGLRIFVDGRPAAVEIRSDSLSHSLSTSEPLRIGRRDSGLGFYGSLDELRVVSGTLSDEVIAGWGWGERIRGIVQTPADKRTGEQTQTLFDYYVDHYASQETREARDRLESLRNAEQAARDAIPTTLVMAEQDEPRKTYVLERGQYDKPGEEVQPGVPASLSDWPDDAPRNRLGLARWLVADDNPLTARVAVNRLWKQCFGYGLVRSMNDFGTQGELPTHPDLLDYLAATFRESGWDVKAMLRLIVTSRTYRQSSQLWTQDGEVFDPQNRLLARGPSFRLPMEMIRDQALSASGLLVRTIGGPSVKPYQPPGLWEEVSYNGEESYVPDSGSGLWRRSVYTYIKRQAPPPSLLLLDGPTREKCTIERPRTNTPLQSLLLLNDETYLEAARVLAEQILSEESDDAKRMQRLWQTILTREPTAAELERLTGLLTRQRERFAGKAEAANRVLSVGEAKGREGQDARELAAWTIVAHTVFNLDEAIVRR